MILRWIYERFKQRIWDLLIEDFYGSIPDDIKEPSIDFLVNGRERLEKFWSLQAYNMQRRSVMDSDHADVYKGILIIIRAQLVLLSKSSRKKYEPVEGKKEADPLSIVDDFVKIGKEKIKKV